ncbi:hypothetical protein BOQ60_04190 [Chryseobacterium sp. CH1]|nr:hypothetical protein BOQ60_04190 [Chryseobacterium sp. CH1]
MILDIYLSNKLKHLTMKNLRKLNTGELKKINGGRPPLGCNNWDPEEACCRSWASGYCGGKTCPSSPPPLC